MAKGVLIDTWIYSHKALEALPAGPADGSEGDEIPAIDPIVRDKKVKVSVRLLKTTQTTDKPPHATSSVSLEAECRELGFKIEGTDVEALRRAVWARLDKAYEIRWSAWYLIHVQKPYMVGSGSGSGVVVSWDIVSKGVAWDGTELLREWNNHRRHGEELYKVSPWPGAFRDKGGRVEACIPVNDRNTAALEEFAAKIDQLRKLMAEFLSPQNIEATLANLAGVAFLPPPDPDAQKEHADDGDL